MLTASLYSYLRQAGETYVRSVILTVRFREYKYINIKVYCLAVQCIRKYERISLVGRRVTSRQITAVRL